MTFDKITLMTPIKEHMMDHADKAVEVTRNISGVSKVVRAFYYGEQAEAKKIQEEQQ